MMKRAEPYGIKFIICMHDRYMLDSTWGSCDGYCSQYVQPAGTLDGFYRNKDAINAYDQRLQHIVSHQSVNYTGKTWAQLSNVIFAFEIQNEGQASGAPNGYDYSVDVGDRNWWCGRATALKASAAYQGSSIYVSTGGGKDFYESILDEHFACGALDVIALHSYSTDINDVTNNLESAVQKATTKYVLFEEYGTNVGSDKAQWFQSVAQTAATLSAKYVNPISWMPWEAVNPGNPNDYEFWDDDAFIAVATAAKSLNP
ncbi:hypothetical protein BC830DRAFT_719013 [Chytriomyces sp. MP71]|nr:hypothetical protein BC830DRAFT_719013 [Chytriomyces sp. MP71]